MAGSSTEVCRVLAILEERGHSLGLHVNINKCEVYCHSDLSHFPPSMKQSHQPNIEILGIPIGDLDFCTTFISHKHGLAKQLMLQIEEVGALDPQVALMLLRTCSGFSKLSHLARATPPSLSVKALELFDQDVRSCLSQSTSVDLTDVSWNQAQLSLSRGGLGMRSLMLHAPAAYIASVCSSGYGLQSLTHLTHAVEMFNVCVAPADKISLDSLASSNINQKMLSSKLDDYQLQSILNRSSVADRARLLSISAPHSSSWLSVVPSEGLGLHFEPNQYNVALKWWLGLDTSCGSSCAFCPDSILDLLGHHASTCKQGGDAVHRHNLLRDVFADSCCLAHLPVKLEVGNNLTPDHDHSRPADVRQESANTSRSRLWLMVLAPYWYTPINLHMKWAPVVETTQSGPLTMGVSCSLGTPSTTTNETSSAQNYTGSGIHGIANQKTGRHTHTHTQHTTHTTHAHTHTTHTHAHTHTHTHTHTYICAHTCTHTHTHEFNVATSEGSTCKEEFVLFN